MCVISLRLPFLSSPFMNLMASGLVFHIHQPALFQLRYLLLFWTQKRLLSVCCFLIIRELWNNGVNNCHQLAFSVSKAGLSLGKKGTENLHVQHTWSNGLCKGDNIFPGLFSKQFVAPNGGCGGGWLTRFFDV